MGTPTQERNDYDCRLHGEVFVQSHDPTGRGSIHIVREPVSAVNMEGPFDEALRRMFAGELARGDQCLKSTRPRL